MANTVWVLTREHNDYDQYGRYFCAVFAQKPTHQQLEQLEVYVVPKDRLRHVLNGGGRKQGDDIWWFLEEVELK